MRWSIARTVSTLDAIARESALGSRQAAQATTQLSHKAEVLRSLAGRFRLPQAG